VFAFKQRRPTAAPLPPAWPQLGSDGRTRTLLALVMLGLGQALLAATSALGVRALFEHFGAAAAAPGSVASLAAMVALAGGGLALLQLLLRQSVGQLAESLGQRYAAAVRSALLAHLFQVAPQQHQQLRHGHLMARVTGDLAALRRWVGRSLAPLMAGSATLLLMLAVLAVLAPALTLALALVLALAGLLAWRVSVRLEQTLRVERQQRWALAGQVGERLAEAAVVQAHAQSGRELKRLARRQQRLHDSAVARARWSALLQAVPLALGSLLLGAAAGWGAWQVAHGAWTAGTLAGLLTLLGLALAPVRDLTLGLGAWRAWRVSREKLIGFMRLPTLQPAASEASALRAPEGALRIESASHGSQTPVGALALAARGTLAVHGRSGSGKSLLLQAMTGLHTTTRWSIAVDGQSLASCDAASIGARVALVSADLPLLRGTIAGNLRYRTRRATPETMQQALAAVGLDAALATWPLGLATPVREGGRNLPGVLRHRLALARALISAPALLLIDDFDLLLEGDEALDRPLAELLRSPPCTLVIVTRSAAWRERCQRVLSLDPAKTPPPLELVHAA
jgi:ATP-binding cassette, subfamily B, bacterial